MVDLVILTPTKLGCSPAELEYDIELERPYMFFEHEGCPEMIRQEVDNA